MEMLRGKTGKRSVVNEVTQTRRFIRRKSRRTIRVRGKEFRGGGRGIFKRGGRGIQVASGNWKTEVGVAGFIWGNARQPRGGKERGEQRGGI